MLSCFMKKSNLDKEDIFFFRIMNVLLPFMWGMCFELMLEWLWLVLH